MRYYCTNVYNIDTWWWWWYEETFSHDFTDIDDEKCCCLDDVEETHEDLGFDEDTDREEGLS